MEIGEPGRRWRWDAGRVLLAAGALLAAGHAALFWTLDALPFQDLPNHLTRAVAEVDLLFHGGARFGRLFVLEPVVSPYLAGDVLLAGLVALFGEAVAGRVWLILVAASFPIALAVYLRVTRHDRLTILVASVLSIYLTTDRFFLFGMHHFRLGVALVLLALAAWEVWLRSGSAGGYLSWTALLVTGYLVHLSALLFTAAAAGLTALVSLWMRQTRWARPLAGSLPVLALLAWQSLSSSGAPGGEVTWGAAEKFYRTLFPFLRYRVRADGVLMLLFALTCLTLLLGGRMLRSDRRFVTAGLLSALFLAAYAVMPYSSGPLFFLDARAMPLAACFALVAALSAWEHGARRRAVVAALAICLAAGNLAQLALRLPRSNAIMRDYRALAASLPPEARVFTVASAPDDGRTNPLFHAGSYATLDGGALTPYIFAGGATPYFRYRAPPVRPLSEYWYYDGRVPDRQAREAIVANYDYVLLGNPYDPARLPIAVEPVARNRGATLLRIVR